MIYITGDRSNLTIHSTKKYTNREKKTFWKKIRTLNLMVVPVGAAVKLLGPKREPDVLPKGLEVVFVVPKSPPLLVLAPKSIN